LFDPFRRTLKSTLLINSSVSYGFKLYTQLALRRNVDIGGINGNVLRLAPAPYYTAKPLASAESDLEWGFEHILTFVLQLLTTVQLYRWLHEWRDTLRVRQRAQVSRVFSSCVTIWRYHDRHRVPVLTQTHTALNGCSITWYINC